MEDSTFLIPAQVLHAAKLSEGMTVADFGAGSGFFTRAAARAVGEHAKVWAVDIQQDLLPRIKNIALAEGLKNVEVVRGDLESQKGSGLPDEFCDFIVVSNMLFGAEDKAAVAREVARVLKRGGRALVIDWTDSFGGLGPHKDHVLSQATARTICEDAGLTYVQDIPAGAYHWGFVVRKKGQ